MTPPPADGYGPAGPRDTLFISHANPADNDFTRWLALQLARHGYKVWCDLTNLLGGDDFWADIEQAIRQRARKIIYVVSRTSNAAGGVLRELAVANGVGRQLKDASFIIPVKIDDLPYGEHNIEINRLNALTFTGGWATGLASLLKTLCEEGVPREPTSGPGVVAAWWNNHQLNREILRNEPQSHWTNWFPLRPMPAALWSWRVPRGAQLPNMANWPAYRIGERYVSFASAKQLTGKDRSPTGGSGAQVAFSLDEPPPRELGLDRFELRTAIKQLLRRAWDKLAEQAGLPLYALSSDRRALWFPAGSVSPNGVSFVGIDGRLANRQLYGHKTVGAEGRRYKRFYHYGLQAVPVLYPSALLALKGHVIFTLDGNTPHGDVKYQHRARRSQCKAWWNDRWRDLLFAAMAALAKGKDELELPLCPTGAPKLAARPVELIAPLSYRDEDVREPAAEQIGEDDADADGDHADGKEDEDEL
jgi:hypothetical protein